MEDMLLRLVSLSVERDTPPDLLRALRQVAGNVELICVGNGRWWMGLVRPSPAQHVGTFPMGEAPWSVGREQKLQLQRQGFRLLGEYTDEQLSADYLVGELQYMLNRSEKELDAGFEAALDAADFGLQRERAIVRQIMDKTHAEVRSIWAKAVRKRTMAVVQGLKGAST